MQGTTITNPNDISESQNSFNNLLNNTIAQGQSLLNRKQIIDDYVEAQKTHLEASAGYQPEEQSVGEIIAQNCASDLTDLNYDVVRSGSKNTITQQSFQNTQDGVSPFKSYLNERVEDRIAQEGNNTLVSGFNATTEVEEEVEYTQELDAQPEPQPEIEEDETVFENTQDLGETQQYEDQWTKTQSSINDLQSRHQELSAVRKEVNGPEIDPIVTSNTIPRQRQTTTQTIKSNLNTRELEYALETPLRSTQIVTNSKLNVGPGERIPVVNSQNLINRYHTLRQQEVGIKRNTLKFAENRINPPKCLLDVLDSLFSLLFGVYSRLDANYFTIVRNFILVNIFLTPFLEEQEILCLQELPQ